MGVTHSSRGGWLLRDQQGVHSELYHLWLDGETEAMALQDTQGNPGALRGWITGH